MAIHNLTGENQSIDNQKMACVVLQMELGRVMAVYNLTMENQ